MKLDFIIDGEWITSRMSRKCKTREEVACLLATAAGSFLLPALPPVTMWTNASEYANEHSCMLLTQSNGGLLNDLIVFISSSAGVYRCGSGDGLTTELTPILNRVPTLPSVEKETGDSDLDNELQER